MSHQGEFGSIQVSILSFSLALLSKVGGLSPGYKSDVILFYETNNMTRVWCYNEPLPPGHIFPTEANSWIFRFFRSERTQIWVMSYLEWPYRSSSKVSLTCYPRSASRIWRTSWKYFRDPCMPETALSVTPSMGRDCRTFWRSLSAARKTLSKGVGSCMKTSQSSLNISRSYCRYWYAFFFFKKIFFNFTSILLAKQAM